MLTKERRPLTEAERERVCVMLSATYQRPGFLSRAVGILFGLAGGCLLFGFLVFLPLTAWNWLAGLLHRWALPGTVYVVLLDVGAGAGLVWAAWMMYWGSRDTAVRLEGDRRKLHQDLDEGEAEVWQCEASRVVQLGEVGEDGPYFLEVGQGQTLFLQLEDWYDVPGVMTESGGGVQGFVQPAEPTVWPPPPLTGSADERTFPCRRFDLVYTPYSRVQLDLVCLGPLFEEWPTHSPGPESTWVARCFPDDGDVLLVSLDTLDADLDRWAAQQEPPKNK